MNDIDPCELEPDEAIIAGDSNHQGKMDVNGKTSFKL
jgi:hypothetical protein